MQFFNHAIALKKHFVVAGVAVLVTSAAFAAEPTVATFSTPGWDTKYLIKGQEPFKIASLALDVKKKSKVLIQFSSEISSEHAQNCPCYMRALVSMDGGKARPIKRINVGSPAAHDIDKYDNDRQNLDGTTMFDAAPGKHTYELTFQQVDTNGNDLEIYYPNFHVIAFPE
ncbi:hypothetical protein [Paraburkholderia sartisoli]|uniref:Uncharacterized protein n=1 Tax=Paraburkholderia sartisoli TaxID=83784 RepID=A0A1H4D1J1_9BURK|nr:hypothetical protein [Paraburkholderia sartisoli]SEA66396.1 hypothetical protein SAMN05192564_102611 [Paraburkholderia sartisoli]